MPFTPYHMGPGVAIKAVLQSYFSLMIFAWTQIVMDIQPLIVMLTGEGHLHGFTHTYIGALLIGFFAAISGKYLSEFAFKVLPSFFTGCKKVSWRIAVLSALLGSFSHVLLDSILHGDMRPYYPLSPSNHLYRVFSPLTLHKICFYSGCVGIIAYYVIRSQLKKKT